MGVVYEAEQRSLRRRVALKVLPFAAALDPRQLRRFHNEAQAAACLHHTSIVPVYYVGCERAIHFYAMQFIEGQSLAAVVRELRRQAGMEETVPERGAPAGGSAGSEQTAAYTPAVPGVPPAEGTVVQPAAALSTERSAGGAGYFRTVARLGVQAAEALEHAHQQGVIHRDIKPGNLLVDASGNLWVTDFGLARLQADAALTMTGDLVGTLRYMSPEQALAQRVVMDHRTDIYSLGASLYELLTLQPALAGSDRQELLRKIAFEEPRPPRRLNQAVPVELETIVLKALEKNLADRYATAQELADDLRRFLEDRPIRARRPTLRQRLTKWGRRHRGVVGTAVVALVLAVVILALSTALVWRENQAKKAALALARQRRETPEKAYRKALEAVQRMLARVADERVAADPQMKDVRRGLTEDAAGFYTEMIALNADDPRAYCELARLLATSSEAAFRDPQRAVTLATKALELDPHSWRVRNTLGMAHYRAGDNRAAVVTLEESIKLHEGGNSFDWFFLALAHWRLGDREQAHDWYAKAVAWMDEHKPEDGELKCFRAEAAELLGVKDRPPRKDVALPKP
jgi:serine/threonine protein kinase